MTAPVILLCGDCGLPVEHGCDWMHARWCPRRKR